MSLRGNANRARILPLAIAPAGDRTVGYGRIAKSPIMHASSIHRRTQRILELTGVKGERGSAQTLRNTYAALLIDNGAHDNELVDFLALKATLTAYRLRQS